MKRIHGAMFASFVLTAGCYTGAQGGPDFRTISNHLGELHLQQVAVQSAVQSCQDGFEECIDVSDAKTCKDEFQECLDGEEEDGTGSTGGEEPGETGAPSEPEDTSGTDTGDAADTDLPDNDADDDQVPVDAGDFEVCVDGVTDCVAGGGEPQQCVDAALACIQETFSKLCEEAEQDCLDAGAPAEICEGLSDKC